MDQISKDLYRQMPEKILEFILCDGITIEFFVFSK